MRDKHIWEDAADPKNMANKSSDVANTPKTVANTVLDVANKDGETYRYRDQDKRKLYMKEYMRKRRSNGR